MTSRACFFLTSMRGSIVPDLCTPMITVGTSIPKELEKAVKERLTLLGGLSHLVPHVLDELFVPKKKTSEIAADELLM